MKLTPMATTPEPTYPSYPLARTTLRRLAAALAVSASLLLPACGNDDKDTVAVPGRMQPAQVVTPVDEPKPPETVAKPPEEPAPEPRLSGARVEPVPPVRTAGTPPPAGQ